MIDNMTFEERLLEKIELIREEISLMRDITFIPCKTDFNDYNGIYNLNGVALFADFGGTTNLIDSYDKVFSSWLIKSYLTIVAHIVKHAGGIITAFEGDGVMTIFMGDTKENDAVKCAFQIHWVVVNIIQPQIDILFPELKYKMGHVIGIDSSDLSAVKTDVWDHYDLLWIGRAANYAANFTRINEEEFSTYITSSVYSNLSNNFSKDFEYRDNNEISGFESSEIEIYSSGKVIPISN
jgi:class 3 adenylate cyclase